MIAISGYSTDADATHLAEPHVPRALLPRKQFSKLLLVQFLEIVLFLAVTLLVVAPFLIANGKDARAQQRPHSTHECKWTRNVLNGREAND